MIMDALYMRKLKLLIGNYKISEGLIKASISNIIVLKQIPLF